MDGRRIRWFTVTVTAVMWPFTRLVTVLLRFLLDLGFVVNANHKRELPECVASCVLRKREP